MFSLSPRTQAVLLLVGIFALGLVCGAIAERRFMRTLAFMRDGRPPRGDRRNFGPGRQDERIIERLRQDLELSEEQTQQLQTLFEDNRREIEKIRQQIGNTMRVQEQEFHEKVKQVLTPDQAAKFEERNRRRGFRGRRGPPEGRPPGPSHDY